MQRKSQWKDKCVGTLWKTQKMKTLTGEFHPFFLLHFKSPESLVYFYRSLVRSRRGTVPGRWKSLWCICGITARAALFWASVLWPFWPFLTLHCVAPKQYQLIILSVSFVFFSVLRPTLWDLERSLWSDSMQERRDMQRGSRRIYLPLPRRICGSPMPHWLHPTCVCGRAELYRRATREGQ